MSGDTVGREQGKAFARWWRGERRYEAHGGYEAYLATVGFPLGQPRPAIGHMPFTFAECR